jgi:predicted RNA-binding protein
MLRMASEHTPRQMFHKFVSPYYDQIEKRDVSFFRENKSIYKVGPSQVSITDELVDKLSEYWDQLTDDDHTVIWDYMNLLVKLCQKCENMK